MTTDCTNNRLYKQQIVQTKKCPYYRQSYLLLVVTPCVQRAWVCRILVVPILSYGSPALQGWERRIRPHEYWELRYSHKKKENPAVEILLSIRRTWPCQGRQASVAPLHDKKRHQGLCVCLCLQRLWAYPYVWPIIGRWVLSKSNTTVPVSSV